MKSLRVVLIIILSLTYSWLWLFSPSIAQPQFNIVANGNFSQGLTSWSTGPFSQGHYDIGVVTGHLRVSLMNDTNARAAIGQAWQFNSTGFPVESAYSVKDNNHLSVDVLLDVIAREFSNSYVSSFNVVVTGTPNTTITYTFNGTKGLSNPLNTVLSNSSITGQFCFIIQMKNQTWTTLDRNVMNDLAAVAPALDPALTKYIAIIFKIYFLPTVANPLPHKDYLRTWFGNVVLGGAFSVKVYDVPGAVITLDSVSQTIDGGVVQFVNVPAGGHQLTTTSPVIVDTSRYIFANWTVTGMPGYWLGQPLSLPIYDDASFRVGRSIQFLFSVVSNTTDLLNPTITNVNIFLDGGPPSQTPCAFWLDQGSTHTFGADNQVVGSAGFLFQKWVGSTADNHKAINSVVNPIMITASKAYSLTATYTGFSAGFALIPDVSTKSINQGGSASFNIGVIPSAGFNEQVIFNPLGGSVTTTTTTTNTYSASTTTTTTTTTYTYSNSTYTYTYTYTIATSTTGTSRTGLMASLTPQSGTPPFTAILSVWATGTTAPGSYFISIQAHSATSGKTSGTSVAVNVGTSDFSISVSSSSQLVYQSLSTSFLINVVPIGGFSDTVSLSLLSSALPASLSTSSGIPPFSATLAVSTTNSTPIGTYSITVQGQGTSSGLIRSTTISVAVVAYPPNYVVTVGTSGLPSAYPTKVYVDSIDSGYTVRDGVSQTFSFKALVSHNITVDLLISGTNIQYRCTSNNAQSSWRSWYNPNSVIVSDVTSLSFSFSPEYLIVFKPKLPNSQTMTITVNGVAYTDETPYLRVETWFAKDTSLPFSITPTKLLNVGGKNYTFLEWRDQNNNVVRSPARIRGPLTLTAQYIISDLTLTVYDIPGATISLGSMTKTIPDGATHVTFDVTNGTYMLSTTENLIVTEGKIRIAFASWKIPKGTGTEYPAVSVNMSIIGDSIVAEAKRSRQYYMVVSSQFGSPRGSGWYAANTTIPISVTSPVDHGNNTRRAFVRWYGEYSGTSPSTSVFLDSPKTILAEWKVQYKLTISSQYGTTIGDGWYDRGSTATFSITPPSEDGTLYIFTGWTGGFSGTERAGRIEMDAPKSVSATWRRQYLVSLFFLDTKDTSVNFPPSRVVFSSPNASTVTFTSYTGVWLDEGTWVLKQVIWHGVDVKKSEITYNSKPRDTWRIPLQIYSLTVKVTSSLTGGNLGDATVSIILPDGSQMIDKTDSKGQIVFAQLPSISISINVEKDGSTSQRTVQLSSDHEEGFKVLPRFEIIGYIMIPIVGVAALIVSLAIFMRRRKRALLVLPNLISLSSSIPESLSPEPTTMIDSGPQIEDSLSKWIDDELKKEFS